MSSGIEPRALGSGDSSCAQVLSSIGARRRYLGTDLFNERIDVRMEHGFAPCQMVTVQDSIKPLFRTNVLRSRQFRVSLAHRIVETLMKGTKTILGDGQGVKS